MLNRVALQVLIVAWAVVLPVQPVIAETAELSFNGCEDRTKSGGGMGDEAPQSGPRDAINAARSTPREQKDVISGRLFKSVSLKQVKADPAGADRGCWARLDGVWRESSEIVLDRSKDPEGWAGASALQRSIANGNFTTPHYIVVEPGSDPAKQLTLSSALAPEVRVEYISRDGLALDDVLRIRGSIKSYFASGAARQPKNELGESLRIDVTLSGYVRLRLGNRVYLRPKPGVTKAAAQNQTPADDAFLVAYTLENMIASRRGYDVVSQDPFFLMQNSKSEVFAQVDRRNYIIEERRIVPMGFTLHKIDAQGTVYRRDLSTSERDTQRSSAHSFGGNLSGSGQVLGYGVTASAGFEHAKSTVRSMRSSETVAQAVGMARVKQYALIVDHPYVTLSESFIDAVEDARRHDDFESLIRSFGTHYSYATTFGAVGKMTQNYSQSSLEKSLSQEEKNSFNTSASIANPVGASMSADSFYSKTNGSSNGTRDVSENERSEFVAAGGNGSWNEMGFSPGQTPYPILLDLRPLHELLNPINFPDQPEVYQTVRPRLATAIKRYVEAKAGTLDDAPLVAKFAAPPPPKPKGRGKRTLVKTIRYSKGDIGYYRTERAVAMNNVRICMVNRTGQPKSMRWTKIQRGVGHLVAKTNGSQSCATVRRNQRVEWNFMDRAWRAKADGMNLKNFGGMLIEFYWVRDY